MIGDDHDIVVEMSTDIKWIRTKLTDQCDRFENIERRTSGLELWQAEMIGLEIPTRMEDHDKRITVGAQKDWMTKGIVFLLVMILGLVSAGRWIDFFW